MPCGNLTVLWLCDQLPTGPHHPPPARATGPSPVASEFGSARVGSPASVAGMEGQRSGPQHPGLSGLTRSGLEGGSGGPRGTASAMRGWVHQGGVATSSVSISVENVWNVHGLSGKPECLLNGIPGGVHQGRQARVSRHTPGQDTNAPSRPGLQARKHGGL